MLVALALGCASERTQVKPCPADPQPDPRLVAAPPKVVATASSGPLAAGPPASARVPTDPAPGSSCRSALAGAGLDFRDASPFASIVDPVAIASPLHGVAFRHAERAKPGRLFVDCRFGLRLSRAAKALADRGVREVIHLGTYERRCVGGGTPETRPGCTLSPHALGMAIDVVAFRLDDRTIGFAEHFVRRKDDTPTCETERAGPGDAFLKDTVCALDGTFSVLLTPNWDARHWSHAHFDLRPPSKAPWANGVDPLGATD